MSEFENDAFVAGAKELIAKLMDKERNPLHFFVVGGRNMCLS